MPLYYRMYVDPNQTQTQNNKRYNIYLDRHTLEDTKTFKIDSNKLKPWLNGHTFLCK